MENDQINQSPYISIESIVTTMGNFFHAVTSYGTGSDTRNVGSVIENKNLIDNLSKPDTTQNNQNLLGNQYSIQTKEPEASNEVMAFEFKIGGMTCVNCSNAIEKAMQTEFEERGLLEVQIALLTHKMRITFGKDAYDAKEFTTDEICDEVEMIGFDCELLEIFQTGPKESKAKKGNDDEESHRSFHVESQMSSRSYSRNDG